MKRDTFAMTQDDFITFLGTLASGRISPKIANAVITQFGGWQEFKDNGMHVPECAEYPVVSSALACFAANEVTFAYDIFKAVHGNGLST